MADKTIGDLTQAESIGSEDLFVLEQSNEAKKLKGAQLVKYAQDAVGAQVTAATQAAENAAAAKTGAESAQTEAQAARDAILNMIVEAITLESGTAATVEKSLVDSVYKLTFGLPKGEKGAKGETGPANTLTIGIVRKGTEAAATIAGSAPDQTLNLMLPKGDKGDKGETGPEGPQGPAGAAGQDGKSAYTAAQEGGYTGAEAEFNAALASTPGHIADSDIHVTNEEKTAWSAKQDTLTGTEGQAVIFDADGKAAAADTTETELMGIPAGVLKGTSSGISAAEAGKDYMGPVAVTAADNGKFLRVVNGAWAAASVADASGVSF